MKHEHEGGVAAVLGGVLGALLGVLAGGYASSWGRYWQWESRARAQWRLTLAPIGVPFQSHHDFDYFWSAYLFGGCVLGLLVGAVVGAALGALIATQRRAEAGGTAS